MILSINQPAYLPWLGYFDRIARSDLHIVLDHVQFEKNSMTNRNKVRTKDGWAWLTVPLRTKGRFGDLAIRDIEINNTERWAHKHMQSLQSCYGKAVFFGEHKGFFESVYNREWPLLGQLLRETTEYFLKVWDIKTPLVYSSEIETEGVKDMLVLNLCKKYKVDTYISGPFGRDYLNPAAFTDAGIKVLFHDYPHPEYKQVYPGFEKYMSAPDLLFNHGPEGRALLQSPEGSLSPS